MLKRSLLAVLGLALLDACSDSSVGGGDGDAGLTVETQARPQLLVLGQSFTVTCSPSDGADRPTSFSVSPAVSPVGDTVTPAAKGEYQVTCALQDGTHPDATPAAVHVLGPDELDRVQVETQLAVTAAAIGKPVPVTCRVRLDGQELAGIDTDVRATPADGVQVVDHTVTGAKDGEYAIACGVAGSAIVDPTPETLSVGKGKPLPARVTTQLSKHTAASGEAVDVTCTVTDAAGNVIDRPTAVQAPSGVAVADHTVTGQQAGDFPITCVLAEDAGTVETVPDTLTVTAGEASGVEAWVEPQKDVYKPGEKVTVKWKATDAFGNEVKDAPATVTGPTDGLVSALPNAAFELLKDGSVTFTVTLTGGSKASDDVSILVDGTGPVLVILSPERGQTLAGPQAIVVTGTAKDEAGALAKLTVNGTPVPVNDKGEWTTTVDSVQAMNVVVAEAEDDHGNPAKATVAWYYSTGWVPMDAAQPDLSYLAGAVKVWLSQEMIDDGDHAEPKIDDLATLLEILLTNVDFAELLGKPALVTQAFPDLVDIDLGVAAVKGGLTLWADVQEVTFGKVTLSLKSRQGGLDLKASFVAEGAQPGLTVGIGAHGKFDLVAKTTYPDPFGGLLSASAQLDPPPSFDTTTTLTMQGLDIDASFDIFVDGSGELQVVGKDLLLTPKGIALAPLADATLYLGKVTFKNPILGSFDIVDLGYVGLDALVDGLNGFSANLIDPILNTVIPLVTDLLEPLIAQLGGQAIGMALKSLELDQSIAVPELVPGQPKAEVQVKARISDAQFTTKGGAIGLDGLAIGQKKIQRDPLGAILRDGCLGVDGGAYALPKTGPMELAVSLDVLNEVLFSLWYAGGLNLTLDAGKLADLASFGVSKADITLAPLLPPAMTDCNAKGTLKVQLGDAHLAADLQLGDVAVKLKAWLSAEVDVGLLAQGSELGFVVNGVTQFQVQVYDVEGPFKGMEDQLEQLLQTVLLDQIVAKLADSALASFPLPEFDLGGIVPGVPEGTKLMLGDLGVSKKKGYLQIEGKLEQ